MDSAASARRGALARQPQLNTTCWGFPWPTSAICCSQLSQADTPLNLKGVVCRTQLITAMFFVSQVLNKGQPQSDPFQLDRSVTATSCELGIHECWINGIINRALEVFPRAGHLLISPAATRHENGRFYRWRIQR